MEVSACMFIVNARHYAIKATPGVDESAVHPSSPGSLFVRCRPLALGVSMRFCLVLLMSMLVVSFKAHADNAELAQLAAQDQTDRAEKEGEWGDNARRKRVLELLATGAVSTPQDKLNAALILQHTPGRVCEGKLGSVSPENYLLAHYLAKAALDAGLEGAKQMVAVTIDRYLSFTEGRQRYGTSQLVDLEPGESYLPEIDRSVSDEERAELGVPPLGTVLKQAPERKPAGD